MTPYAELAEVISSLHIIIRSARRARGLSVRAAAKQMGISFSTLSRCETRTGDLRMDNLVAILHWLDQTRAEADR